MLECFTSNLGSGKLYNIPLATVRDGTKGSALASSSAKSAGEMVRRSQPARAWISPS